MRIKLTLVLSIFTFLFFSSCQSDDNQTPQEAAKVSIDKKAAVDIKAAESFTIDGKIILTISKTAFDNNGLQVAQITTNDTFPGLGSVRDTLDTGRTYTDDNDDQQEIDTVVDHPKHYNYYFAVKTSTPTKK